jgi:hypothetical protein
MWFSDIGWSSEAACSDNQPYEICLLEIQRNNAMNDLVRVASEQSRQEKWWKTYLLGEEVQRQAMDTWWRAYQDGLEQQRQAAGRKGADLAARAAEAARRH